VLPFGSINTVIPPYPDIDGTHTSAGQPTKLLIACAQYMQTSRDWSRAAGERDDIVTC
jgi:hypothetical protein